MKEKDFRNERSEIVQNLRGQVRSLENIIGDYRKEHGVLESFFSELHGSIPVLPSKKMVYAPKTKVASPCTAVMCNNDGHYGMVQPSSEVEGFGEYNPAICEKRKMHYCSSILDWVNLHRKSYQIDELVILDLGDNISGDIHEELRITNAFPTPVQCTGAGTLLANQIAFLAPYFKKVRVEFIVEDNHARLTKKPQAKEAGLNSFNYVVGFVAKTMLRKIKNVEFNIYPRFETVVNVQNRKYLLTHGHGIIAWMGTPWYSVERRVGKEAMKRMNAPDDKKFHKVIGAHWHTPIATQWYWFSGSCSGTDAYDHKNGRHSTPSQAAWFVHTKHGEFDRTDFDLDIK